MAEISNLAGGLVCEQVGVVPIDKRTLEQETLQMFGLQEVDTDSRDSIH